MATLKCFPLVLEPAEKHDSANSTALIANCYSAKRLRLVIGAALTDLMQTKSKEDIGVSLALLLFSLNWK